MRIPWEELEKSKALDIEAVESIEIGESRVLPKSSGDKTSGKAYRRIDIVTNGRSIYMHLVGRDDNITPLLTNLDDARFEKSCEDEAKKGHEITVIPMEGSENRHWHFTVACSCGTKSSVIVNT